MALYKYPSFSFFLLWCSYTRFRIFWTWAIFVWYFLWCQEPSATLTRE